MSEFDGTAMLLRHVQQPTKSFSRPKQSHTVWLLYLERPRPPRDHVDMYASIHLGRRDSVLGRAVNRSQNNGQPGSSRHPEIEDQKETTVTTIDYDSLLIGGGWTAATTDNVIDVLSANTGQRIGRVPDSVE